MNKKMIVAVALFSAVTLGAYARPHGGPGGPGGGFRGGPGPAMRGGPGGHHHGGGAWGHGGRNFWPGFVGGVVGGVVGSAFAAPPPPRPVVVTPSPVVVTPAAPVVVTTPTVVTPVTQVQNVWVEGRYVDQVQPNGAVIRTWQPGHYESRTVVIQ